MVQILGVPFHFTHPLYIRIWILLLYDNYLNLFKLNCLQTACLVQWLVRLTAIQEVPGLIPGYTLEIFLEVQGLERGPPSLVRTIGQLLDMRSSEIRLGKLKLRLRDKRFANHKAPCTAIWQQPLQSVLALRGYSATDIIYIFLISPSQDKILGGTTE